MAKKNQKRRTRTSAKSKPQNNFAWLLVGLLCGALLAGLFYLYQKGTFTAPDQTRQASASNHVSEPQFDFYSILPNMNLSENRVTSPEAKKPQTQPIKPTPAPEATQNNKQYFIQVASFIYQQDASRMKAELILDGYTVQVKKFEKEGATWYRVMVGPFTNITDAKATQRKLRHANIDNLLVTSPLPT